MTIYVNGEKAAVEGDTVVWRRSLGAFKYPLDVLHKGWWKTANLVEIDGKTIEFKSLCTETLLEH